MPANHRRRRNSEGGFVLFLYTLMLLFVIIPMVGLAIDGGIMYFIKGKLQTAVDGAALGAARSLNRSTTPTAQQSDATDTADRYYRANYPCTSFDSTTNTGSNCWMGVSSRSDPTVTFQTSASTPPAPLATVLIGVQGDINAPTWFMRILGFNSVHLTAYGQASRRNVNIILVIDRSTSLTFPTNYCPALIADSELFVNSFSNGRDQVALETFGTFYNMDYAFSNNFQPSLITKIGQLVCAGFTNAAAAYSDAYYNLSHVNGGTGPDLNALNVVLFFTDGIPNTITFGPYYKAGATAMAKSGGGCTTTSFSGTVAGDVSFNANLGIAKGHLTTWPIPSGGEWQQIDAGQGGAASGCNFNGNFQGSGQPPAYATDVNCLPSTDSWGDSLTSTWAGGTSSGFPAAVTTGTGGCVQDSTLSNVENAGINALDNAAQAARVNAAALNMPFVVYTIGFGASVNAELLKRIANDATSAVHQTTYTTGTYYAADSTNLASAFGAIAGDILRLAK